MENIKTSEPQKVGSNLFYFENRDLDRIYIKSIKVTHNSIVFYWVFENRPVPFAFNLSFLINLPIKYHALSNSKLTLSLT